MKKIPLMKNTFSNESFVKRELVKFIKKTKKLSMGTEVLQWEKNFSKWQKRKYSLSVNSGSSANLVLIQSLINLNILKKNDLVAISGITWSTNPMPLIQLGLKVKAIDINLDTLNVNLNSLKEFYKNNKNLKCFFATNVLGFSDNLDQIRSFCLKKNIVLIEDNCESLGSQLNKIKLGNFGLASTFSTFVGHHLSTIEGGLICTDDKKLYNQMLIVRAHGWDRNLQSKEKKSLRNKFKTKEFFNSYTFYNLGYNVRPTEISGKLGNLQIKNLNRDISVRQKNFFVFLDAVNKNKNLIPLNIKHMNKISNFAFPVICKSKSYFNKMIYNFKKFKIEIRPIISGNILRQPFLKKYINQNFKNLINSDYLHEKAFYFPNNPELSNDDIKRICFILEKKN